MRPFICGNWKLNLLRADALALATECAAIARNFPSVEVGIAPPILWGSALIERTADSGLKVLAQNVWKDDKGAFTGENSLEMIVDAQFSGVIIGHSERRTIFGETDALIGQKVGHAISRVSTILCVGETLAQRESNETIAVVRAQLDAGLALADDPARLTVAYEPVWAIGTGRTASPEQAEEVHAFIRSWLCCKYGDDRGANIALQYGGSVTAANARDLLAQPNINGALVGGASLKADSFRAIVEAAAAS